MTTNYERIKSMTVDEMAEFSSVFQRCSYCALSLKENGQTYCDLEQCRKTTCKDGIKQWLMQRNLCKGEVSFTNGTRVCEGKVNDRATPEVNDLPERQQISRQEVGNE